MPCPIWRRLLAHFTRLACSRARLSDGSRIEISSAIMPITTSSSTRVNPFVLREASFIKKLLSGNASRDADRGQADGFGWNNDCRFSVLDKGCPGLGYGLCQR